MNPMLISLLKAMAFGFFGVPMALMLFGFIMSMIERITGKEF